MRIERVVINASPLIMLFRAGLHPLLPQLFPDLVVPEAVWAEVVSRTYDDPATQGLPGSAWARKLPTPVSPDIVAWNLGAGETAALSFVQEHHEYTERLGEPGHAGIRPLSHVARFGVSRKRCGYLPSPHPGWLRLSPWPERPP